MINVIYLISSLRKSGPVNVLYDICKCIDRTQYNPIIVTLKREDETRSIKKYFLNLDIQIHTFNFSNLQMEIHTNAVAKLVSNCIPQSNSCIIHAHCYHGSLIATHIHTYPNVETIHCIVGEDYKLTYGFPKGQYLIWRHKHSIAKIDYPVAISSYMFQYYKKTCNSHLRTIFNGVDFSRKESVDVASLKEKLGLPLNKKIVLYSGYFSVRKNAKYIISELKKIETDDFICVFLGKGNMLEECKLIANNDSRFVFEGYVFNVKDYLAVSDIYVSASKSEGFPLAVLEALNMGIPSLLSAIPPHNEIYDAMSIPGIKTFSLNEDGLKIAFEEMYKQYYDNNAIAQKSYNLFSAEAMTREYQKLYNSILMED